MLANMSPKLQRQHENIDAHTIILYHRELFDAVSKTKRYETSKELFHYKMTMGSSVNTYALKMTGYIEKLAQLGFVMNHELSVDLILLSLP
jgi:hypothetical protein